MWVTVLFMAVVCAAHPQGLAVVAYFLSRPRPLPLLVAYFIGGFGSYLILGAIVLFVLKGVNVRRGSSVPPEIEVAVGALALMVAALVGSGIAGRLRAQAQARHSTSTADSPQSSSGHPDSGEFPGSANLGPRVQAALRRDSPWIAWITGLAVGMPTVYYLAAIADILKTDSSAGLQVAALIVFNVIAFSVVEIAILSFVVAPEATRTRLNQLSWWATAHERILISALSGVVGVYLLVIGIRKL
jgi:hypothetical protein